MSALPQAAPAKVRLARDHLRRVNPWSALAVLHTEIAEVAPGQLAGLDAAIVSFDNPRARFLAARRLLAARVPFVDAGALAERWQARVSVCDPRGGGASRACPCCAWSEDLLARAGEDVGLACAGVETGEGFPSTLVVGQRAATLAVRALLALAGVVPLPTCAGQELRDDLAALRTQSFTVSENAGCAADHALAAGGVEELGCEPEALGLAELAARLGLRGEDEIVLAGGELVTASRCRGCHRVGAPFRRVGAALPECPGCGGATDPLRRARRVRFGAAAASAAGFAADAWFARGERFAVSGAGAVRVFAFPSPPLAWEAGRVWDEASDRARFERLPADWDLARIRATRIGFLGVGHVGGAAVQQLAPFPWSGVLLVDRDRLALHNRPSLALATEAAS